MNANDDDDNDNDDDDDDDNNININNNNNNNNNNNSSNSTITEAIQNLRDLKEELKRKRQKTTVYIPLAYHKPVSYISLYFVCFKYFIF